MKKLCNELSLFTDETVDVIRVPLLVKGKLVMPPEIKKPEIEAAFRNLDPDATYVKLGSAQLLREPVIDRKTLKLTGEYIYQVLPPISAGELIESDLDQLIQGLYALPFSEVLKFLAAVKAAVEKNPEVVRRVLELSRRTAQHPDVYLDRAFAGLPMLLDPGLARAMVESELSAWGKPGSQFLDGWVEVPATVFPGLASLLAGELFPGHAVEGEQAWIRALPTRQLHITAGNAPAIPLISALRAILTKSAAVIKSPYGATLPGALLALAAVAAAPDHPITQNLSIVYWQGGDESVEKVFFMPQAFDRIVVWGAPEAVASVQQRALFTRAVYFNPRYGISMIGREAFAGDLETVAIRSAADTMIWNQKACISSQVHYVEGSSEQANLYAEALRKVLAAWDGKAPQFVEPSARGRLKRMRRGKYLEATWFLNHRGDDFASGVVVMPEEFDIVDHPMCRLVVVRRVDDLQEVLKYLHPGVSTAGVYPEERRFRLRDPILARGVSNVFPLGQCERMFGGMPHDGMMVLSLLVDWKNG